MSTAIKYPYHPEGRVTKYVPADNEYMVLAKLFAKSYSLDKTMPSAAVIVRDGVVLGIGANGSDHHERFGCRRVELKCKTGEGYELCEGCHPKNHSEPSAIRDAQSKGHETAGADLYLWGHWWFCESCWSAMAEAGIRDVFLITGSERLFNRSDPENIVGRQFVD